jgi:hypothetical protein
MTIEELKTMSNQLVQAIHDYKTSADYDGCEDEIKLERAIDGLLCRLPRDIVYIEWYDRSDINNKIMLDDSDEIITEEMVDNCMQNLWDFDESIMDDEIVSNIVNDTINETKGE